MYRHKFAYISTPYNHKMIVVMYSDTLFPFTPESQETNTRTMFSVDNVFPPKHLCGWLLPFYTSQLKCHTWKDLH